jgi:hypothetical protein
VDCVPLLKDFTVRVKLLPRQVANDDMGPFAESSEKRV